MQLRIASHELKFVPPEKFASFLNAHKMHRARPLQGEEFAEAFFEAGRKQIDESREPWHEARAPARDCGTLAF